MRGQKGGKIRCKNTFPGNENCTESARLEKYGLQIFCAVLFSPEEFGQKRIAGYAESCRCNFRMNRAPMASGIGLSPITSMGAASLRKQDCAFTPL